MGLWFVDIREVYDMLLFYAEIVSVLKKSSPAGAIPSLSSRNLYHTNINEPSYP